MSLNAEFLSLAQLFKNKLLNTKELCDKFDDTIPSKEKQLIFIEKLGKEIFPNWDDHFLKIWDIYENFDKNSQKLHQKYYQQELVPLFYGSPYNRRVYEKPLGYAGDYIMMLYLYENGLEGKTTFDKLVHRYSMLVPTARANHNRKNFYKKHIIDVLEKKKNPKITSVASGPTKEIIEILQENQLAINANFYCVDFEKEALDYVKDEVSAIEKEKGKKYHLQYINSDILGFVRGKNIGSLVFDQDLIYSSGLIDYFSDRIAAKFIRFFLKLLGKNGKLIVGNVATGDKHRAYTEILGEWYLHRRDQECMLRLIENIKSNYRVEIAFEEETKMNVFLIIQRND
jgi:extracellular factor (EF) 3-hydroxypalmitic acid methyl ester biosynthesis protein